MIVIGGRRTDGAVNDNDVCANCALYLVNAICGAIASPLFMTARHADDTCEDFVAEPPKRERKPQAA